MKTIRVDGNDLFAVYHAVKTARETIINEKRPVLIEAISYRVGDHSTSDFSQLYWNEEQMKKINLLIAKLGNPIKRLEKYLLDLGWIEPNYAEQKKKELFTLITQELKRASLEKLPPIDDLFTDIYHEVPPHIKE